MSPYRAENPMAEVPENEIAKAVDSFLDEDLEKSAKAAEDATKRDAERKDLMSRLHANAQELLSSDDFERLTESYLNLVEASFKNAGREEDEEEIRALFAVAVLSIAHGSADAEMSRRADIVIEKLVGSREALKEILAKKVHPEIIMRAEN